MFKGLFPCRVCISLRTAANTKLQFSPYSGCPSERNQQVYKWVLRRQSKSVHPVAVPRMAMSSYDSSAADDDAAQHKSPMKLLHVGILGTPNAGKSTFVNTATDSKVSIVTQIPNTTRANTRGVLTRGDTQIVFVDSPGIIPYQESRRLRMSQSHIRAPRRLHHDCDMLCLIVDGANKKTRERIEDHVLDILRKAEDKPSILVINKVDILRHKEPLLKYVTLLTDKAHNGWEKFKKVFMISALTGDGVSDVIEYFMQHAKPGAWIYSEDVHVDSPIEYQIAEVFREKLMLLFQHEIPWQVKQVNKHGLTILCLSIADYIETKAQNVYQYFSL